MKAALIISGYLRSIELNIQNIKERIINKFDSVDIYIHITINENIDDKYLNKVNQDIIRELNPIVKLIEPNYTFTKDKNVNNLINNWLKYYKLNNIKKLNEKYKKYDIVIKYRPDLNLISQVDFKNIVDDTIYIPKDSKIDKNKLKNKEDNHICDIFAYGSSKMMDKYFSLYEHIDDIINKYGCVPETVLYHYLNNFKYEFVDIDYNVILSKCNVFSITGDSGSGKSTLSNILKKHFSNSFLLECDRYHKWERNDENWKNYTHLNPNANLITKMNSDIFDLRIGKKVYHVDYDHDTGKFTDQQKIESTDNIIVCGLHNLYENLDYLYDLKIFIDTDEQLKIKWKINRDTKERGYSIQKCVEQIENRKEDYEKFIKPQINKSDLIINFFEIDNILKLKLLISNKYNIHKIINKLDYFNIKYKSSITENNYEMFFENYEFNKISFGNIKKENNFYDYIMLVIHNMMI